MTDLVAPRGLVTFHDVAIYFSQVEWKLLGDWQKALYKNVIKEVHGALLSMGYAIDNPGILFRIKNERKEGCQDEMDSDGEERRKSPTRSRRNRCHPDLFLRVKEENATEEPYLLAQQDSSEGEGQIPDPSTSPRNHCHPDLFSRIKEEDTSEEPYLSDQRDSSEGEGQIPDPSTSYTPSEANTLFKIKEVDDSYLMDQRDSDESDSGDSESSTTNHSISAVVIKEEEEEPFFMDHQDGERRNRPESPTDQEWLLPDYAEPDLRNEASARHASISEMEIDILEANRNEVSTKRHTKWAVSIFKGWLAEKHLDVSFETILKPELNKILREFFATVRNSSGNHYSISSYAGLRAGVNRFFNDTRGINIVKDPEFTTANNVFIGVMKSLRKKGKDVSEHNPRISEVDLQILRSSPVLSINTARGLVSKVWFDVQFYFARRGQEGHRDLMPQSFKINRDEQGIEYVTLAFSDKNKHHPSQLKTNKENVHGCMYALPGHPLCPVNSFKKYLSKLPANPPAFYLHPIKVRPELLESQPVWYTKEPLGINYLRRMMPSISQEAGLSLRYTNHSIWSTVVHLLSNSGLQARQIRSDTGHKKEVSIGRYWAESTEDRKPLIFLVPVAAPSTSTLDRGLLPTSRGLTTPVKAASASESTQPSS